MRVIKSENTVFIDVDATLILPNEPRYTGRRVLVYDAVTNGYIKMAAHEPNVRLLLEEKHRGSFIVVWSRGGYEWAKDVLTALDITYAVDIVMSKPMVYLDDMPIEKWLPYRVYLEPDMNYKKSIT